MPGSVRIEQQPDGVKTDISRQAIGTEKNMTTTMKTIFAFLVLFLLSPTRHVHALYAELHSLMAHEAALVEGAPSEIRVYAGGPKYFVSPTRDSICSGAFDEDADRDPRLTSGISAWWGLLNWGTHFWDPDAGPEGGQFEEIENFPINLEGKNSYQRARDLYTEARSVYGEDPLSAYHLLGRVVHLLTDAGTPAHVHLDAHISDSVATGDDSFEEYTAMRYVIPGLFSGRAAFESDFALSGVRPVDYNNLPDGGFPGEHILFRLFYSLAKTAKGFDSDDSDGSVDMGSRRGRSVPISHHDLLNAILVYADSEFPLPATAYQMSPSRAKFVLSDWAYRPISDMPEVKGIRLDFSGASEFHGVTEFSRTDIGDLDLSIINSSLVPLILENIASLYHLFWEETHPSLQYEDVPGLSFRNGAKVLQIERPAPLSVELDILPKGWNGKEVEAYLWVEFAWQEETHKFFYDGQWNSFAAPMDLRPAAQPFRLMPLEGTGLKMLDYTSLLPEIVLKLNICIDGRTDGRYTPAESICNGIAIQIS